MATQVTRRARSRPPPSTRRLPDEAAGAPGRTTLVAGGALRVPFAAMKKKSMTVHLVNLTNPMFMKGPIRELIPISEQKIRVRLPRDKKVGKVQLLISGKPVRGQISGEYLSVIVTSILAHEVVAIDL